MKKIRLIIAVAVAALMVMGVGYALWSQTLPVTVSGSLYTFKPVLFDVRAQGAPDQWHEVFTIAPDKQSATITTPKLYPGRSVTYLIYYANESTDMSARLTGVDFSAMGGERSAIVKVEYARDMWATGAVVNHAGQHFDEDIVVPPSGTNAGGAFRVTISVPADVTTMAYGTDNTFSFTVTPEFEQVNP